MTSPTRWWSCTGSGKNLDWSYIEKWRAEQGTREALDEARAEAAVVWDDDAATP